MKKIFHIVSAVLASLFIATACSDVPAPYDMPGENDNETNGGGNQPTPSTDIFAPDFSKNNGGFTIEDKNKPADLNYVWTYSARYSCMLATGYVSGTNHATESWLVSPEIDLSDQQGDLKVSFEQAANYFKDAETMKQQTLLEVSADNGTTWTPLALSAYGTNTGFDFVSTEASLSAYAGKKIKLALVYKSTAAKAGTWEVKNLKVLAGKASEGGQEPDVPVAGDNGSIEKPYTVAQVQQKQDNSKGWVKAFIVGSVKEGGKSWPEDIKFSIEEASGTNFILADAANVSDPAKCIPVQLPSSPAYIRAKLSLKNVPANLGKEVWVYGDLTKYFGQPALKNVSAASFDGGKTIIGTNPAK